MTAKTDGKVGALMVHGLGGTQFDFGNLVASINQAGIETHVLLLPGHGSQPEDLLNVRAEDWLECVRAEYRRLLPQYGTLHVIGMCMGSLLCLELVKQEKHSAGQLVLLAPPVFLDGWSLPWYRSLRYLGYCLPGISARWRVDEDEPFGIKNEMMRKVVKSKLLKGGGFHYLWVPLYCIQQMDRLRRWVMRDLNLITCPCLVVHAREDELTSLRSAYFLQQQIGSARVQLSVLENSYHMVCLDNDRLALAKLVVQRLLPDVDKP